MPSPSPNLFLVSVCYSNIMFKSASRLYLLYDVYREVSFDQHTPKSRHTLCPLFPNIRLCPQAPSPLLKQTAADLFSIAGVSFSSSGIRSECKRSLHSLESSILEWCFRLTGVVACIPSSFLYLLPHTCMYTLVCSTFQVYN